MVKNNHARLEDRLCRAAFALVLNGNREMRAKGICETISESFPVRLKYLEPDSLAWLFTACARSGLFVIASPPNVAKTYALTPEFYGKLTDAIESETAGLLEARGIPYSIDAGVMLLYHRQTHHALSPTQYSVFRQARDALRRIGQR